MSRLVFNHALRFGGVLLGTLLAVSAWAQSSDDDSRDAPNDIARYAEAIRQQSDTADAQLQQGRALLGTLQPSHGDLAGRVRKAEAEVDAARLGALKALASLEGGPTTSAALQSQARRTLDAMLFARPRVDQTSMPVDPKPQPLPAIVVRNAARLGPAPADLVATLDAPLTPEIEAQAATLGHAPVAIFEWVRKQITLVPSWGSLQGAHGTLQTRRGNAMDQASLLIALLRASGVHSRYVIGNVEADAARMQRWLGVDRIEAVTELFTEGGIPFETVVTGGTVTSLRFQHVWVEAWIDFAPSRGARQRTGDTWVALDPSYRDTTLSPGVDLATLMVLDVAALRSAIEAAAHVDQAGSLLNALGASALAQQLALVSTRLQDVLRSRGLQNAHIGELLPRATDATPEYPFFLGSLPYRVLANEAPAASLGDAHRHRVRWSWKVDDNGLPGADLVTLDQPAVALAGKRIALRFVPAETVDRDVLRALVPATLANFDALPEALPAYLIRLRAELWLDDVRLVRSDALGMGRTLHGDARLVRPDGIERQRGESAVAGETRSLDLGWHGGLSNALVATVAQLRDSQQALIAAQPAAAARMVESLLQLSGRGHFAVSDAYQAWLAGLSRVAFHRAPDSTSAFTALEIGAPFGVVTTAWPVGFGLTQVTPAHLGAALTSGKEPRFVVQSLSAQSAFGHQLLEQVFAGQGRSAPRVFRAALDATQAVYHYTPAQAGQLAGLALPDVLGTPLEAALQRGDIADFTAASRTIGAWQGFGALLKYPAASGGSSFVIGRTHVDAALHRTGAGVSTPIARAAVLTGLLDGDAPPALLAPWVGELEAPIAAGEGLIALADDPLDLGVSDQLGDIIGATILDNAIGDQLDPILDAQVWPGLVAPVLSIGPLLDPVAPTLALTVNPRTIDLGQSSQISASATDNRGVANLVVTAGGVVLTLVDGRNTFTPTSAGVVPIVARARDAAGNLTERREDLLVRTPGDNAPPVVQIASPLDNAAVTQPTDIIGSVSDASLRSWVLAMRPGNSPNATPVILAQGDQPIANGVLGKVDPTLIFNGVYVLILQAEDANGLKSQDSIQVRIDGDMKVGHFRISFEEIEIPLQGIPIRITRTYDTRQAGESLDFGHGWSIDYQNVRIRESRKLGFSWRLAQQGGGFSPFCVRPSGTPMVTITLPNGETEQFNAKWSPECQQFMPPVYGYLTFQPADSRTHSTLEQLDYGQLRVANVAGFGSNLIELDNPTEPADPSNYKLVTEDGTTYYLDQEFGVERIVDQAGNFVHYSRNGITHSSGTSVQFIRDSQDRITDIVLPDGRRLKYRYNAAGDLIEAADPIGLKSTFGYLANVRHPHYLETITDARGVQAVRHEYDNDGRLIATTDAAGARIEYVHNIAGKTETVKNRRGFATTYVYDDDGSVLSETNSLGEQTLHTYDDNGVELSRTDPLGRRTEWTVDVRGNPLTERNPLGNVTTRTWGYYNQLKTEVDALGRQVARNEYARNIVGDETGYMRSSTNALGHVTQTPVDVCGSTCANTGNLLGVIDPLGNRTSFDYDRRGNVVGETDAAGNRIARTYDAMGRMTREARTRVLGGSSESLTTDYVYDAKGRVVETRMPDGSIIRATYNAIDKVETLTDPLGRITRYEYDARGHETAVIHPDGSRESTSYDAEGNAIARTDRAGRITRMVYDAANRMTETVHPDSTPDDDADNARSRVEYDGAGQVLARIDERGTRTEYEYDAAGRQVLMRDALGGETTDAYDAAGQRVATTDALGRTTRFVYDVAGRLVETVYPDETPANDADNSRMVVAYDAASRKTSETDEMGRVTRYTYDGLSRLTQVILPNPATGANPDLVDGQSPAGSGTLVTRYEYDEQGNKTAQIDAEGRITRWTFDRQGRPSSRVLPMGQAESFAHDAKGQRISHTTFKGDVIATEYDMLGRPSVITLPDKIRRLTYAQNGRITRIDEGGQIFEFAYDARDRLTRVTDPHGRSIDYAYDASGNRTELATGRQHVAFTYDTLNRLQEVVATLDAGAPQRTQYSYTEIGTRSGMVHPNGTAVEYQYDVRNRLRQLLHRAGTTAGAALLLSINYSVDASGLRTQIAESRPGATQAAPAITRTATLTYDAVRRLTREQIAGTNSQARNTTWTYDKVGNRKTESSSGTVARNLTYTFDANDRLTREAGSPATYDYSYDEAGNQTQKRQGATVLSTFQWDAENRLVRAELGNGAQRKTVYYGYDSSGIRRAQESVDASNNHVRTEYLVDPNQPHAQVLEDWEASAVGELLPSESLGNVYVHGDDLISQTLLINNLASSAQIYHYDGLGSTRALSAHNVDSVGAPQGNHGQITDRSTYTAFGEPDPAGTSGNNTGTTENAYRYAGEQLDANLGFYYLRARYLSTSHGRFVGMDRAAGVALDPPSLHKYQYAHLNPVLNTDPSGLMTLSGMMSGLSGQVSLALSSVRVGFSISSSAGGAALRSLGMVVESAVGQVLRRLLGNGVQQGVRLVGPGGPRVIDFWLQVGNRIAAIEVKYGLPRQAGAALTRLVGQIRTGSAAAGAVEGEFVLFTWAAPTPAQMALLTQALGEGAPMYRVVTGLPQLAAWVRNFFVLAV